MHTPVTARRRLSSNFIFHGRTWRTTVTLFLLTASPTASANSAQHDTKRRFAIKIGGGGRVDEDYNPFPILFEDVQGEEKSKTKAPQRQLRKTRLHHLAAPFVGSLVSSDDDEQQQIHVPSLLDACRNFAEGMKDVGQHLSARDMRKNIAKAERFLQCHNDDQQSHTMKELLTLERQTGVHNYDGKTLIRLGEESCAMGLLWIRRSLHFQYLMFEQLIHGNDADAASEFAYERSLRNYHGWTLQKVYSVGLRSSSGSNLACLAQIGGFEEADATTDDYDATRQDLTYLLGLWRPLLHHWEEIYKDLNLEDTRRV